MAANLNEGAAYTDVYVNDSLEAADEIHKAELLAARGRWGDAAQALQVVMDTAGDKLVRTDEGYFIGMRDHINAVLSRWPAEGIREYRALYDPRAQEALSALGQPPSIRDLLAVFDRFFCTEAAAHLADDIAQAAIEAGDLPLAERLYRRVLQRHPSAAAYEAHYRRMLRIVAAMRGESDTVTAGHEQGVVRWMGQDMPIDDALAEVRASFAARQETRTANDWPIFGGDASRNRPTETAIDELGLLWRFEGFGRLGSDGESALTDPNVGESRDRARLLTINPVVDDERVFAQWGREVVALHRNTGLLAWRFRAEESPNTNPGYLDEQPAAWDSPTVDEDRVYVSLPGDAVSYYNYESNRNPAELVCLDAANGKVIWRLDQQAIAEQFAEVTFDSSPIVAHGGVLITGRRRRSFGFEDCYLYRFDATTGAFQWRTHLGSASTGTFGSRRPTRSITALRDGVVYVCSNLGTVAAVSAHTGAVEWLRLYARDGGQDATGVGRYARDIRPWQFNPAIVTENRVVILPMDASAVLIYARAGGEPLRAIAKDAIDRPATLFGVRGDVLCLAGERVACVDLLTGDLTWSVPMPEDSSLFGRGAWVDGRLLVPTHGTLATYQVGDGNLSTVNWDTEGEGGNLLALPDQVLVAGVGRLSAYVRRQDIWKTLRQRMATAPSDPLPALELAEVALNNGEFSEALKVLEEAVRRAQTGTTPQPETLAPRLFGDVLLFVERLHTRDMLDMATLEKLFTYASQYPPDTAGHLTYRLTFADLFRKLDRNDRALRLYHQILRDRTLRGLPVDPARPTGDPAGLFAQGQIADLLEAHGRALYEPYEREATQWLDSARAAGDEAALRRVVATFPNSRAAPRALVAQGELLATAGRPEDAAKRFAQAYHRYPKQVDRPAMLRRIADAYESAGKPAYAYQWLTKASREHPSVRFDHEGRSIGFAEYRNRLRHVRDLVEPSRPKLEVPLTSHFIVGLEEGATLLAPRFAEDPNARWSHYFVSTDKGIQAFSATSSEPLWPAPVDIRGKVTLLVALADMAVFATPHQIVALDIAGGARRWTVGEYPTSVEREDADWEDVDAFRTHALRQGRLVSLRDSGETSCVELESGRVIWTQTHRPAASGRLFFGDPWIVYHTLRDDRPVVCLLDAATGTWVDAIDVDENRVVENAFMTLDAQIVVVTSQSIVSYDPETHRRRWQTPVEGHVRGRSMLLDVDALYFSDDGHKVRKISLEDGRQLWESEPTVPNRDDEMNAWLQGGSVIVVSSSSVGAIDAVTGLTLWQGTTPDRCEFIARFITAGYVAAVDVPGGLRGDSSHAYLYDHRNASGLIPKDGAPDLGQLRAIRAALIVDGALLIQTGTTLQAWTAP